MIFEGGQAHGRAGGGRLLGERIDMPSRKAVGRLAAVRRGEAGGARRGGAPHRAPAPA